ncbi:TorF family putative porin [Novosphingobium bradum]|uniref:TorF family putative porin n=1 Tax=Novosphingobium bradum TaxID=1737444 RepID=A0ABV7ISJ6_9SPHN
MNRLACLLLPTLLAPAAAMAQDVPESAALTWSGNVALVSDYRFRGVSQSGGDAAVQGGITATHQSGIYAAVWSSSIDFSRLGASAVYGSQELDLTAGWSREIASGLTADLGLGFYAYPGGHLGKADFFETYGSLATTYGPARLKLGVNYAWPQDSLAGRHNVYLYGSADAAIPSTPLTLNARLGWQDGALAGAWLASGGAQRHGWDWSVGASATVLGRLTLGASYVGTSGPSLPGVTDDQLVGTLSVAF